ncbi:MAG: DUF3857 domain-containing protein [Flavobacterium psychrophilum]|nr:MAG: DUF3857 domain-containing protein [Flavobacterium psychrophilum]
MIFRFLLSLFFLCQTLCAQEVDLSVANIPENLKENADAVVRLDKTDIEITSIKSMAVKKTRIITILNKSGLNYINAEEYYNKRTTIKSIEAVVYDSQGKQLKKLKRKDFRDISISEGYSISDDRMLYLDYTPAAYPFTIVYTCEEETSNTAFIPQWSPVEGFYVSMEKSEINLKSDPALGLKYREYNFEGADITKQESAGQLSFKKENLQASKREDYSPSPVKTAPHVSFGLDKFYLEGVEGNAASWEQFGAWYYENLLTGTDELLPETVTKAKGLTANETDPLKKAKILYEYMQSKTRYVSIQLGIGGWKPMQAKDVDRLGYGDCKALSNYMRALLKAVGVESYCTVIYAGNKRDIRKDFVSMQGNHMILAIPDNNNLVWLECTSQHAPFGFQGDFTDDRFALVLKPGKGEIIKTHTYDMNGNSQTSKGAYAISETGAISADVMIVSKGLKYDQIYGLESRSYEDRDKYYKSHLRTLPDMKIKKADLKNKKDSQEFVEALVLESQGYCSKSGNRMMFAVNAFNVYTDVPQRYRSRKNAFEVKTGFSDTDEVVVTLPVGFTLEAIPQNVEIKDKFGVYKAEYSQPESGKILFKRSLLINEGIYSANEYENYRLFIEKIARNDNAKAVLLKT